jgi:hypothetical protein
MSNAKLRAHNHEGFICLIGFIRSIGLKGIRTSNEQNNPNQSNQLNQ